MVAFFMGSMCYEYKEVVCQNIPLLYPTTRTILDLVPGIHRRWFEALNQTNFRQSVHLFMSISLFLNLIRRYAIIVVICIIPNYNMIVEFFSRLR